MDASSAVAGRAPLFSSLMGSGAFWSEASPSLIANVIETLEGTPVREAGGPA